MKKTIVLLMAVCCLLVSCQKENSLKDVDDVCTTMDDTNFMKYCYDHFDVNHDGQVSMQEAAAVKKMNCYGESITSLKGIEYFTALMYLGCDYNQLTSLDVSKNSALTELDCYSNKLTSLDVSKNTALTKLCCSFNKLTSLDVSKNTALTELHCESDQLTSLDVSKNTALTELICSGNQLTSLDVSKNTALTGLYCEFNQLTSLDVSKNTELTGLNCQCNQLTSLDVSKNTALYILACDAQTDSQNGTIIVYYTIGQPIRKWRNENYRGVVNWVLK